MLLGPAPERGFVVLVEEVESSIRSCLLVNGPRNFVELAEAAAGIVEGREKLQVAAMGGQQQFPERAPTADGFLHRRELHHRFTVPLRCAASRQCLTKDTSWTVVSIRRMWPNLSYILIEGIAMEW